MKNRVNVSRSLKVAVLRLASIFALVVAFAIVTFGQSNSNPPIVRIPSADDQKDSDAKSVDELIRKQQISRQKKEYDEMLKRGDLALKLSEELETSFESKESFSPSDVQKLQELEKIVLKIRDDLGGDNDDKADPVEDDGTTEIEARKTRVSAVKFLRDSTVKLVDELKKSTRFSISVAAVQASSTVVRLARFLRLKK